MGQVPLGQTLTRLKCDHNVNVAIRVSTHVILLLSSPPPPPLKSHVLPHAGILHVPGAAGVPETVGLPLLRHTVGPGGLRRGSTGNGYFAVTVLSICCSLAKGRGSLRGGIQVPVTV